MKGIFNTAIGAYAVFSTVYFATLFLYANIKLKPSTDFYDSVLSSIDVSMTICCYTGIFWCLMLGISGISMINHSFRTKSLRLNAHSLLFLLSSGLVVLQYYCSTGSDSVQFA